MLDTKCKACYTSWRKASFTFKRREQKGGAGVKNRIAELRKDRRISQAELADAVDVTRQTIISLENGRYNASLLLAHRIAVYFGLAIEDIFLFEEESQ